MGHRPNETKDTAVNTIAMIDVGFVAAVFGAILYWIFIAPDRARKRRHQEMHGQAGTFQAWDPGIGSRKRDR